MTQNFTKTAPAVGDVGDGSVAISRGYHGLGQRRGLRGLLALGFLVISAAISYGTVFVLIDMWYKGGSLGIF